MILFKDIPSLLDKLEQIGCEYAFYSHPFGHEAYFRANADAFPSASLIKVPILLAWVVLEQQGAVNQEELCCLDDEPKIEGSGIARHFYTRQLSFHDVLMLMISVSDNLCTNLVIRRIGMERLNSIFRDVFGLSGTRLQRKMMDLNARRQGKDNWLNPADCIRLYEVIRGFNPIQRTWIDSVLATCENNSLLLRDIPGEELVFYHKTGSLPDVRNDWGYTRDAEMFLLTHFPPQKIGQVVSVFGKLGEGLVFKQP